MKCCFSFAETRFARFQAAFNCVCSGCVRPTLLMQRQPENGSSYFQAA
ncbi:hypothetical protein [Kingella sp. (in: b-proteobacteria)]|nr:hypothetical protein [Kingella sp. (in: b-proteobacteria)]MDO4658280.1 hypothetical protein [Kingella sp. (in: b-proteobacteria)]